MRLTNKKHQINIDASLSPNYWLKPVADKLGKLEDIEDELEIDLITLFKALKKGVYIKDKKNENIIYKLEPDEINISLRSLWGQKSIIIQELYFEDLDYVMDTTGKKYYSEDYGKTWALTKGELE